MLEWKRGGLTQEILDKFAVIEGRTGPEPVMGCIFDLKDTTVSDWLDNEWYCVLPEITVSKPATKTVVLEEWCRIQSGTAYLEWQVVGNRACVSTTGWFKTGVTRELEVPDVR
jgi:hypothetical protein